jgi:hypothetical protein
LYKMTDQDWMYNNLKDNLALQALLFVQGYTSDFDTIKIKKLAGWLKYDLDINDKENLVRNMEILLDKFGYEANIFILKKVKAFAQKNNKNLLVVVFDPYKVMSALMMDQPRIDTKMIDFLKTEGFNYFDMNIVHAEDFKKGNLSMQDYYRKYFVGHYDPAGNMFFAFSIKNTLVSWLNPKPVTYQSSDKQYIDFKDYLQGVQ